MPVLIGTMLAAAPALAGGFVAVPDEFRVPGINSTIMPPRPLDSPPTPNSPPGINKPLPRIAPDAIDPPVREFGQSSVLVPVNPPFRPLPPVDLCDIYPEGEGCPSSNLP